MTTASVYSTEIVVQWTEVPFDFRNGKISHYEVLYDPHIEFGGLISYNNVTTTYQTIALVNLEEFVTYSISVRAYNSRGPGPYSEYITVTTAEDGKCSKFSIVHCNDATLVY